MAQNNDHTIGFRKLEERVPDGLGPLALGEAGIGRGFVGAGVERRAVVVIVFVEGKLSPPFDF